MQMKAIAEKRVDQQRAVKAAQLAEEQRLEEVSQRVINRLT